MGRLTYRRLGPAVILALPALAILLLFTIRWLLSSALSTGVAEPDGSLALLHKGASTVIERTASIEDQLAMLEAASITEEIETEMKWLTACQIPGGAIAQTPVGDKVVPYFANFAAKTMIDSEPDRVRDYMTWYLDRLNRPDRFGLAGTIYDYELTPWGWLPTLNYDSADGYAATFLSLANSYLQKTGDMDFIADNLEDLELVAGVLIALQDTDGLVIVAPNSSTKYLMDNCEAYRGFSDWAEALITIERADLASGYIHAADRVKAGIELVLYSRERDQYAHTVSWYGKRYPKTGKWYPDAVSQLYLVTEGVLQPDDQCAVRIWRDLNSQFPEWTRGGTNDGFPWAKTALAAVKMGDTGAASDFLLWASEEYGKKARPYPWYVLESATIIDVYREIWPANGEETNVEPVGGDEGFMADSHLP